MSYWKSHENWYDMICLATMHIGLDFFDASINRVAAWVMGTRNTIKALLRAMLEPVECLETSRIGRGLHIALALRKSSNPIHLARSGTTIVLSKAFQCVKSGSPISKPMNKTYYYSVINHRCNRIYFSYKPLWNENSMVVFWHNHAEMHN